MSITRRLALATFIASGAMPLAADAGTLTTLYVFKGSQDGAGPYGPVAYEDGALYGVATYGGTSNLGAVFEVNADTGAFLTLYSFQGGATDGQWPAAGVIDEKGILYGTNFSGGTEGYGTIFSLNVASGTETILYDFPSQAAPQSLVYLGGELYGASRLAGGYGSIFSLDLATDSFNTVYTFTGGNDGNIPGPVLLYQNGLFYGSTYYGGPGECHKFNYGCGVVFSVNPTTGAETVIHAFSDAKNGKFGYSNLVYFDGKLIGDTVEGGSGSCPGGCGVSFAIKASTGKEKVLESGAGYSGLTKVGDTLYETLPGGGAGFGELVQVDLKSGQQTVLYTFTGGKDGSAPEAPLTYYKGVLYGTTQRGGDNHCTYVGGGAGCGTVFKFAL
jgi:uncharacterized repeat protein (TIGR03803 family)